MLKDALVYNRGGWPGGVIPIEVTLSQYLRHVSIETRMAMRPVTTREGHKGA